MITSFYAAILAIFYIVLAVNVVKGRYVTKTGLGDGGNDDLSRRIRMHGNFSEYVPFALLLLFFVDDGGGSPFIIHVLGTMLVLGRLCHALGLNRSSTKSMGRMAGMILTFAMMLICAVLIIYKYFVFLLTGF